jgi:hypothetical protein
MASVGAMNEGSANLVRCRPRSGVTIAVPVLFLAVLAQACSRAPVPMDDAEVSARPTEAAVQQPGEEAVSESPESATSIQVEATPEQGSAAVDVIRTRIAYKERAGSGEPTSTPTPLPPAEVRVEGEVVVAPGIALMWTRSAVGTFEYGDAVSYCTGLEIGDLDDWRLPQIAELERLLATDRGREAAVGARVLWSSTPDEIRGVETVEMPSGIRSHQKIGFAHVICVRAHTER